MSIENISPSERFLTQFARIWLFTRVSPHVTSQIVILSKRFLTHVTGVWFLTRVSSHVDCQGALLVESFSTIQT